MAFSVALVAKGVLEPPSPPKSTTSWAPWPSSKPYRWALVAVTADTTSYTSGGLALDVLGTVGWEKIVSNVAPVFTMNSVPTTAKLVAENDGTAGNRKIAISVLSSGAEHAASACSAVTFDMWLTGY